MSDQSGWTIQLADTSLDQLDRSRSDIESFGRVGFKARLHLANVETNIFWLTITRAEASAVVAYIRRRVDKGN
ncbi:UPF0761 membrane protein [Trichinella pseudospiralis]